MRPHSENALIPRDRPGAPRDDGSAWAGFVRDVEHRAERASTIPSGRGAARPGTASGVVFITLEDETGIANLILRPKVFERFRPIARLSAILLASGRVERKGEVVHVQVNGLESLDHHLAGLAAQLRDFH